MSSSARSRHAKCHVLNFFTDEDNSAALTVMQNGVRFHIIADAQNFGDEENSGALGRLSREYGRLTAAVRKSEEKEDEASSPEMRKSPQDHDSGIDLTEPKHQNVGLRKGGFEMDGEDAEQELQNWMLSALAGPFEDLASTVDEAHKRSLHDWFCGITNFFNLEVEDEELAAMQIEETAELKERMANLVPGIVIPKYIKGLKIPRFEAEDLKVIGEADEPAPYHPSRIGMEDGKVCFLKLVDPTLPGPTKRELRILKEIEKKGLHEQINVPLVLGLVYLDGNSQQIMGFLQTEIKKPTPLTILVDEDISQRKRDRWAKEAERVRKVLHENDIIWGDAKADNFMVDEDDQLWIIDFGGSYTVGWVDAELEETEEGDDMGVEKIVNALHDPLENTVDLDERPKQDAPKKRRAVDSDAETKIDDHPVSTKRRKTSDEEVFCLCNRPEQGIMVACDNADCSRQWFHLNCVGLDQAPRKDKSWCCEDCQ